MSKCREAYEKQYGEDFNPDHSPVASVWQAAWNARGRVDAALCAGLSDECSAYNCVKAIEQEDEK